MNLYLKRLRGLEQRLHTALTRGDGASASQISREIDIARCGGSTTIDYDDFYRALLQRKLGERIPTRDFRVKATKQEMADLAQLLRQKVGL